VPLAHRFPHAPQFELSICSSTHAVPHGDSPAVHVSLHAPPVQSCAPMHWLPQLPQSFGFDDRSTQTPPHDIWPAGQAHAPPLQVAPAPHALPQAPQLASSL
jgi:hypothetical protein